MVVQNVRLQIKNEQARSELEKLIREIPGYRTETDDTSRCDLLIFELTNENIEAQFDFISASVSSGAVGHIFLISAVVDPNFLIQALKIGAKEFFPLPLKREEVRKALLAFQTTAAAGPEKPVEHENRKGTIVDVIGSKGGVGTTTIAVNLGRSLIGPQKNVALVDMNLLFGDIPVFLGMESPLFDWAEIARNITRLDSSFLMGTLYKHPSGLHVLPSPAGVFETFNDAPAITAKLLTLMRTMFDYVVIDGGQELGDMAKSIMKAADRVILVTLLNLPGLINVKKLRETFLKLGYPSDDRVSILANRVDRRSGDISVEDAERTIKKKVNWTVRNDFQNTMRAVNMGKTLIDIALGSEITKQISDIAGFLNGRPLYADKRKKGSLFGGFF